MRFASSRLPRYPSAADKPPSAVAQSNSGIEWVSFATIRSHRLFATGLAAGTATAWISELPASGGKSATGRIASAANFIGLAAGPLVTGLLASFAPWPLHLPFVIHLVVLLAIGAAIIFTLETVEDPVHHIRDLSLT